MPPKVWEERWSKALFVEGIRSLDVAGPHQAFNPFKLVFPITFLTKWMSLISHRCRTGQPVSSINLARPTSSSTMPLSLIPTLHSGSLRWREVKSLFDINIQGVFHCIKAFVPAMVANETGIIVNLSSGWGRSTSPEVAPYCASKWAMEGLSKAMAQELPRGMACIPLNPGVINTDMLQSCFGPAAGSYPGAD